MADSSPHRPSPVRVGDMDENAVTSTMTTDAGITIEGLRNGVDQLAQSERMDKDSALTMTRLFHSMETLMRHECTLRDAQISRMECEIERTRIQHELDRIASTHIVQQQLVESTPHRRIKSKW